MEKHRYSKYGLLALVMMSLFQSCIKDDVLPVSPIKQYIFMGHIYDWERRNKIDARLETIDFRLYDGVWLGGDLCAATTEVPEVVDYLDQELLISRPTTLWTLGNHDANRGNMHYITDKTGRRTFYTHHQDGLTFIVLDNNLSREELYGDERCALMEEQYTLVQQVLDTIQSSSHLIILSHLTIWGDVEQGMNTGDHANADSPWWRFLCFNPTRFKDVIYPVLKEVKDRGVEVIVLAGDGGAYSKGYRYKSQDGIQFLISGINNSIAMDNWDNYPDFNFEPDSVLIFSHDPRIGELNWRFQELNELIK